ncbi:MAG TPA: ABC transporter permease, partial [Polyangiaceae bacterium]
MAIPLTYNLKSLWGRRATSLGTAAGIALLVFVLASSLMLTRGVESTLLNAGTADRALVLDHDAYSEDGSRLSQSVVGLVAAAPGVLKTAEGVPLVTGESVVQIPFSKIDDEQQIYSVQIRGVTQTSFRLRPAVRIVEGRLARPSTNEVIVGRGLVGQYSGLEMGKSFELGKNDSLTVVGVFDAESTAFESEVWADLDTLRAALGWNGYVSSITAQLTSPTAFDAFLARLQLDRNQGVSAIRERAYYQKISRNLAEAIQGLGGLLTLLFSLAAVLGAMITMYAAVGQRTREIGVLRALGFTSRQVLAAFLLEALALSLIGAGIGVALALVTPFLDFHTTNVANGQTIRFRFLPTLTILLGAMGVGAAVGMLGGFFPALRASRIHPTRA